MTAALIGNIARSYKHYVVSKNTNELETLVSRGVSDRRV